MKCSENGHPFQVSRHLRIYAWSCTIFLMLSCCPLMAHSFCPPLCSCDDATLLVDCHMARNLKMVPIFLNPQIKFLSLAQNQINEISMSLQFYSELQLLDFSQNQIHSLGGNNFENLKNLKVLNVSYNGVKELGADVFLGLKQTVVLDLSANQIERIDSKALRGLVSLKELYLDRNRLEALDWDLFVDLVSLEKLSARFNFIRVLEPPLSLGPLFTNSSGELQEKVLASTAAWSLTRLSQLDVSHNQLTRVRDYGLSVLPGLQELDLCCNYVHTVEERAFAPFTATPSPAHSLARVNLSHNRLGRVPTEALEKLGSSLLTLDLSSNRLTDELAPNSFRSLFQLQRLDLSENPGITSIDSNALLDNVHLVSFEANQLSNLTTLPVGLFNNKPYLQVLALQFAQISVVPEDLFTNPIYTPLLPSLELTGNPIDCNCSAYPLFQYIAQLGTGDPDSGPVYLRQEARRNGSGSDHRPHPKMSMLTLQCASPPRLNQIPLKDLSSKDFEHCFDQFTFPGEHFELLVILLGAGIVLLIFVVVGARLCCIYGLCTRCRQNQKSQHDANSSTLDEFCSSVGGMSRKGIIVGPGIPLPLSPALSTKSGRKNSGLVDGMPMHRFAMPPISNGNTLNSQSRYSNGNNGTMRSLHHNFLPRVPSSTPQSPLDYEGFHQYTTISNRHPASTYSNNKLRFDPKMQLVLGGSDSPPPPAGHGHRPAPPPMILHYEYDYPDYRNTHTSSRMKQVPSVLV